MFTPWKVLLCRETLESSHQLQSVPRVVSPKTSGSANLPQ